MEFDLGRFFRDVVPTAVILLPLTGAFVKWLGELGVQGKLQLLSSMVTGLGLGGLTAYFITSPDAAAEWFAVVLFGLVVGLATSGVYELQKGAAEKAVEQQFEGVLIVEEDEQVVG